MFTIYALVDPRDYLIRYVGMTNDVYRRFREHVGCEGNNPAKDAWIRDLQREQEIMVMKPLDRAGTYEEALLLEEKWIKELLEQGFPLFNISRVEAPCQVFPVQEQPLKLPIYVGKRRHTAREIDDILDEYLTFGNLPKYVSERQRRDYRNHPRLEDRRRLLAMSSVFDTLTSDAHPLEPMPVPTGGRDYPDLEGEGEANR